MKIKIKLPQHFGVWKVHGQKTEPNESFLSDLKEQLILCDEDYARGRIKLAFITDPPSR